MRDPATELGSMTAEPKMAGYSTGELLQYEIVDLLAVSNWQRSKDGSSITKRPKPLSPLAVPTSKRHGGTHLPPDQVMAILRRMRTREVD